MPRRGWTAAPDGWEEFILGPRPPSVKWPLQGVVQVPRQPRQQPNVSPVGGRWRNSGKAKSDSGPPTPEAVIEAAQAKVQRLERALESLEGTHGPAVEAIQSELRRARAASRLQPVSVRLAHSRSFVECSKKHIAQLEADRAKEEELLRDAENRVRQLEGELAQSDLSATGLAKAADTSPDDMVHQLQEQVAQLQAQLAQQVASGGGPTQAQERPKVRQRE